MNKKVFLKQLSGHLNKMPKEERDEIVSDFEEYFEFAEKESQQEEAICERLGDPKKIAKEYYTQKYIEEANKEKSFKTISRAIAASAGLGFANFLYVLCVVIIGYIVISTLYITVCSIGLSAIAAFVFSIVIGGSYGVFALWLALFTSVALIALSVLGFIGTMQIAKLFRRANMSFLNMTKRGIKRRPKDE